MCQASSIGRSARATRVIDRPIDRSTQSQHDEGVRAVLRRRERASAANIIDAEAFANVREDASRLSRVSSLESRSNPRSARRRSRGRDHATTEQQQDRRSNTSKPAASLAKGGGSWSINKLGSTHTRAYIYSSNAPNGLASGGIYSGRRPSEIADVSHLSIVPPGVKNDAPRICSQLLLEGAPRPTRCLLP